MTTLAEITDLKIGNTEFNSVEDYRKEVHGKILKKASSLSVINPIALMGFHSGEPIDFKLYESLGFNHPKSHDYYKLTFNENGDAQGDSRLVDIYNGILQKGIIDDPIIVYPLNREGSTDILILDGATRTTCISYIIQKNPELFKKIPITVFVGTEDEAKAEMVRRNLSERSRCLSDVEVMYSIRNFINMGWTKNEISERLGKDQIKWRPILDNYIKASESLIPELVKSWEEGKLNRSAAFEAAKATVEEQESVAEIINKGDKVKGSDIRKKNSEKREMRPKQRLTTVAELFDKDGELSGFLASKGLKEQFDDKLANVFNVINSLRDEIESKLNKPAST